MPTNVIQTKEKKHAGQNWGKPEKWAQRMSSKKVRKDAKEQIRKNQCVASVNSIK